MKEPKFSWRDVLALPFALLAGLFLFLNIFIGGDWTIYKFLEAFVPDRLDKDSWD
jgi:hypothetical protein